uniref:Uncharacterized protein n=1 Tax=Rhizophora mucronata TaxID=61149 RepID=A0A2P2LBX8_RHIMU
MFRETTSASVTFFFSSVLLTPKQNENLHSVYLFLCWDKKDYD